MLGQEGALVKIKLLSVFTALVILPAVCTISVAAVEIDPSYGGYTYSYWRKSVDVPVAYVPVASFRGEDCGTTEFDSPSDMYMDDDSGLLYILDSGNGRVVVLDSSLKFQYEITSFTYNDEALDITGAQGIFVYKETLVIADTENARVLYCNSDGQVVKIIEKPDSKSFGEETQFKPSKVVMDYSENLYVVCSGVYKGAAVFDREGQFSGFFGANRVALTLRVLADALWKRLLSEEQTEQMITAVPVEFQNLDIDSKGFIYSCTKATTENVYNTIRKLNYAGNDVYNSEQPPVSGKFGELDIDYTTETLSDTQFSDINIDDKGIISAIDTTRGRVFQYDQSGHLVSIFGGYGEYIGCFKKPTAIEKCGVYLVVLDAAKNTITSFRMSEYGELLFKAVELYNSGKYSQSIELWNQVLSRNRNCELAYNGIADALYSMGKKRESLKYYKLSYDQDGYSEAFSDIRNEFLRDHFWIVIVLLVFMGSLPFLYSRLSNKKSIVAKHTLVVRNRWVYPLRMMIHPVDSCADVRYLKKESYLVAGIILALYYVCSILKEQFTGFLVNIQPAGHVNILIIFISTVGVFVLFTISNLAVSTLSDGEGNYKQIFCITSYALLPSIIGMILVTILSNILVLDEIIFLDWISLLANGYSIILIIIGLKTEHQYEGSKPIINFIFSVIGLLLIFFLILLLGGLIQQLYVFIRTLIYEWSIRGYL